MQTVGCCLASESFYFAFATFCRFRTILFHADGYSLELVVLFLESCGQCFETLLLLRDPDFKLGTLLFDGCFLLFHRSLQHLELV